MILRPRQIPLLRTIRNMCTALYVDKTQHFSEFCDAWKEKFAVALTEPNNVPKETWEEMRRYVMNSEFKPSVVDTFILKMCINKKYPEAGISYYKFLESNNYEPSVSTLSTYLQLYGLRDGSLTEAEKEHVLSLCKSILNKYSSLNSLLINVLVKCLCQVGEWQEAVKIIENFKENQLYIRYAYTDLISYLYENGKDDLGHKYLVATLKTRLGPFKEAYDSYLKYCSREEDKFNERIEELFALWNKYGIKPTLRVALEVSNACNKYGWSAEPTRISRSVCVTCKQKLAEDQDLTDEEYERLRKVTMKRLISDGMYYVTNPEEIKRYVKFIDERKPYDVIIDGLNMFYTSRSGALALQNTVRYYNKLGKKILIIARYHMKKMLDRSGITDKVDYFYVENWSKDDIFLLYAAFSSGKDTIVISKDLMRQHKTAMMDIELDALFKKWQATHQFTTTANSGCATQLNDRMQIDAIVQKNNNCWHVPHVENDSAANKSRIGDRDWFCFKMPSNKSTE